jgi:hypothetical protein
MKVNSINDCKFLKFLIYFMGGHCDYSPQMPPKKPDTPYFNIVIKHGHLLRKIKCAKFVLIRKKLRAD